MIATAPGKVMLAGEYAVLEGGHALVLAVDRRARVSLENTAGNGVLPPEARAALAHARRIGLLAREAPAMAVDATRLAERGRKLGIGSSAAVAVACVALAAAREGVNTNDQEISRRIAIAARAGHREAQGGGSGVDVLASAFGGALRVGFPDGLQGEPDVRRVNFPVELCWAVLWTGTPARTSDLLSATRALAARDAATFAGCMSRIRDAEESLTAALERGDLRAAIRAVSDHAAAMDSLGRAADSPVVTDAVRQLGAQLEPLGAAVKPSGAGGGDIVLAVAQDLPTLHAAVTHGERLGFEPVALSIDPGGVRVEGVLSE